MKNVTLRIQDIESLNGIKERLDSFKPLSNEQQDLLLHFLSHLPPTQSLIAEKVSFDETFAVKVYDLRELRPDRDKWFALFKALPSNGSRFYPSVSWVDVDMLDEYESTEVFISVSFVPSYAYSKNAPGFETVDLHLNTDGTAKFVLFTVQDTRNFPELYSFEGSWKEAYLMTVKTLKEGWPQTKFPKELEKLLPK